MRFEGKELVDTGVVDEDVETAEGLSRCRDELADVSGVGQVGLHGDGFATGGLNALDEGFGGSGAAGVVDDNRGSVGGETLRDGRSYSFGGAGNESDFAMKICHLCLSLLRLVSRCAGVAGRCVAAS